MVGVVLGLYVWFDIFEVDLWCFGDEMDVLFGVFFDVFFGVGVDEVDFEVGCFVGWVLG